jgi:ketosteroid isomerase-like protein
MNLDKLRINQLSDEGWAFYRRYLEVLDAYDLDGYMALLSDDVSIQFNNEAPMVGKASARAGLDQFWGSVTTMGFTLLHEPLNIYGEDHHFVMEALNHYSTRDGKRITVHATAWTDRNADGKVTAVRLYQDVSPLFT